MPPALPPPVATEHAAARKAAVRIAALLQALVMPLMTTPRRVQPIRAGKRGDEDKDSSAHTQAPKRFIMLPIVNKGADSRPFASGSGLGSIAATV